MPKLNRIFLLILCVIITHLSFGQYAGTYTVGGSSPTFVNLDSAFNNLERKGVKGSVRLNVRSGTYLGQTTIDRISGASNANLIKVAPDPNNSGPVIFKNKNTSKTYNFILNIKQGFLRFDSLDFRLDSSSYYGRIVDFTANCEDIIFNTCIFHSKDTSGSIYDYATINDAETIGVNNLRIWNCIFYNGGYAIHHSGSTTGAKEVGFEFKNNKVYNVNYLGAYIQFQISPVIHGNYIHDNTRTYTGYGIHLYYCDSAIVVTENQVYMSGLADGIVLSACSGSFINRVLFANNMVCLYERNMKGSSEAVFIGATNCDIYNNSVRTFNKEAVSSWALTVSGSNNKLKNNNVVNSGGGYAFQTYSTSTFTQMDNNNYYTSGKYLVQMNAAQFSNLSEFQIASGMDYNSISSPVNFKKDDDLHTNSFMLNGAATPIAGLTIDIDKDKRNSINPDIGADEFDPLPHDITLVKLDFTKISECGMDSTEIGAIIKNVGQNIQANFNIYSEITGAVTNKLTHYYSDSLRPLQLDTIYFNKFSTFKGGTFNFKVFTSLTADGDMSNDTLSIKRYFNASPKKPESKSDTFCNNVPYFLTTKHESGTILRWYKTKMDTRPIIESNGILGSNLQKDTNYYISSVIYGDTVSSSLTTQNAKGSQCAGGIMFDIIPKRKLVLDSISSIFYNSGLQTVYIYTKKGSYSGFESYSTKWKLIDSIKITPTSLNNYVKLASQRIFLLKKTQPMGCI